ncbi:hypothetical protein [Pararhodospirillum oryzae]|uniref:Glycosyltransferase n=1 Tax=Pararhodospirillum oryzae TaxID=478448 RepID=A0A512H7K9_9PROT|nr:hypothetical protein [Pararhodospirillum oryzae]GEO81445.1 hypothetical protein ROR02_15760 [Pararhodospirillum oryzae]
MSALPRLILATGYDDGFAPLGDLAAGRLRAWGARLGVPVHVERALDTGRPPAWAKIAILGALLNGATDWVLWVDADALVLRLDADPRPLLDPGRDLWLACHHQWVHPMPGMAVRFDVPNTGVMALKASDWTRDFLARVWAAERWLNHPWWENAAVLELMGYHRLLDPEARNAPDPAVMDKIGWLDWAWNSVPDLCEVPDPVIRHYTRRGSLAERLAEMRRDLETVERDGGDDAP